MSNRLLLTLIGGAALMVGGCDDRRSGPLKVSVIGGDPVAANPNLTPLNPPASMVLLATAQGLVRFDAAGQIEPGLAQSWIVSDDGLRYTFRLSHAKWDNGRRVTAAQVVARLRAAASAESRNPLKPLLGAVEEIEAMTDDVLEISLVAPRPNFLQLLAQPEMAILNGGRGTGPYRMTSAGGGAISLYLPQEEAEGEEAEAGASDILLRGEPAALAIARFKAGESDLVTGGDAGSLPLARAAAPARNALRFDPALGLFGLSFSGAGRVAQDPEFRRALSMAIDRAAIVEALDVTGLSARDTIVAAGVTELGAPTLPAWAGVALAERRAEAMQVVAAGEEAKVTLRVAMPDGPGYRLIFAHLRRDWRAIGVMAQRLPADDRTADLRFIDRVARVDLATWYLRQFTCDQSRICNPAADALLAEARRATDPARRQALLSEADRLLTQDSVFVPIADPVRWSLVAARLTGFAPNVFAHHNVGELIAERQ